MNLCSPGMSHSFEDIPGPVHEDERQTADGHPAVAPDELFGRSVPPEKSVGSANSVDQEPEWNDKESGKNEKAKRVHHDRFLNLSLQKNHRRAGCAARGAWKVGNPLE